MTTTSEQRMTRKKALVERILIASRELEEAKLDNDRAMRRHSKAVQSLDAAREAVAKAFSVGRNVRTKILPLNKTHAVLVQHREDGKPSVEIIEYEKIDEA